MSKLFIALVLVSIACAAQGCSESCNGLSNGNYPSYCGPCSYYYSCNNYAINYHYCEQDNFCIINGVCRMCGDTCEGKPDGYYPSVNRARPYYYQCEFGQLYYLQCQAYQVFNPYSRKCQCYEGVCQHGDGWRSSFCRGVNWRVYCYRGQASRYRKCPGPRPYCCCRTNVCVSTCGSIYKAGGCCRS